MVLFAQKVNFSQVPAKLLRIDVQNASSGHGGRRGMFQVADLKQKSHRGGEWDTFIISQSKDLHRHAQHVYISGNIHNSLFAASGVFKCVKMQF